MQIAAGMKSGKCFLHNACVRLEEMNCQVTADLYYQYPDCVVLKFNPQTRMEDVAVFVDSHSISTQGNFVDMECGVIVAPLASIIDLNAG